MEVATLNVVARGRIDSRVGCDPSRSVGHRRAVAGARPGSKSTPAVCQAASLHFGTPRHSWPHFGRVRNLLIPQLSGIGWLAAKCAQQCRAELITALNLHGMTNGIFALDVHLVGADSR